MRLTDKRGQDVRKYPGALGGGGGGRRLWGIRGVVSERGPSRWGVGTWLKVLMTVVSSSMAEIIAKATEQQQQQ